MQPSPHVTINPLTWLRWWFTPRSTHPERSFRERSIRWFIALYTPLTVYAVVTEIVNRDLPNAPELYFINLLTWFSLTALMVYLLLKGKLAATSIVVYLMLMRAAFFSAFNAGYDSARLSFTLVFLLLFFAVMLPARFMIPAGLSSLALSFFGVWLSIQTGARPPVPEGASLITSGPFVVLFGLGIPLTYLRAQLDYHINELLGMVNSLERRVEQRTKELEIALEAAETANQVKSQFLASMSHELRTPLNAILNFNEMMALGMIGPVTEEQADLLNKSLDSGRHLLNLINDVLDMSKIQSDRLTLFVEDDIDLNAVLASVQAVAESLSEKKPEVTLITEVQPDLPRIRGDERRIRQILLNLVSNAVKFTTEGSVTIRATALEDGVRFAVIDTGPGIDPEQQQTIFEPFIQTDMGIKHQGGSGLGLPISRSLVELHGGRLWLESTPGDGAAFFVELPRRSVLELTQPG